MLAALRDPATSGRRDALSRDLTLSGLRSRRQNTIASSTAVIAAEMPKRMRLSEDGQWAREGTDHEGTHCSI